jgi:guanyl-specific ribonuclease Sa
MVHENGPFAYESKAIRFRTKRGRLGARSSCLYKMDLVIENQIHVRYTENLA